MKITLIAHDIRSTHNVGAFFRTCDGLGIRKILFSGYTPYPTFEGDSRLPHYGDKITRQIHKTALGAESTVNFERFETIEDTLSSLEEGTIIISLEQADNSFTPTEITDQLSKRKTDGIALVIGNEIHGVNEQVLKLSNFIMEIPMKGSKESINVSVATGIALYELSKLI